MNVTSDVSITVKEGDLELRVGKALSTFTYKGQDRFVFRTSELVPLQLMIAAGKIELDAFYAEQERKNKPMPPPTSSLPVVQLDKPA
jgi:hypothetical protein